MSANSLAWLVGGSVGRSLGSKLLFVFPRTNAQLDLTKRKMSSNGSANVKHSEEMSDEILETLSKHLRRLGGGGDRHAGVGLRPPPLGAKLEY